jgi:hypothetical protein
VVSAADVVTLLTNIISEAQNGSREKKSTTTATQTVIEHIKEALDNKS